MYQLFLDDIRSPPDDNWIVCRSTKEAMEYVTKNGMPGFMSLDHDDLGGDDTTMVFLKRLTNEIWDGTSVPPKYKVHSANPAKHRLLYGELDQVSFIKPWFDGYEAE